MLPLWKRCILLDGWWLRRRKGQIVYVEGARADAVYFLVEGDIRIRAKGRNARAKVGMFFGMETLKGERYRATAVAKKDSIIRYATIDRIQEYVLKNTELG